MPTCFCVFGLIIFALATVGTALAQAPLPADPLNGVKLFQSKSCVQCHHLAGESPGIAPSLGSDSFQGTFLELGASLWNHAPAMGLTFEKTGLPWPQVSSEEITELLAFLYFVEYLGRPGVPEAGKVVFERKGCSSCHEIGSGRSSVGPDLSALRNHGSPLYVAQEIWNHGPSMFESMQAMSMDLPGFDQGNLADLSAYIRQQTGGSGEPLLQSPGNPNQGRNVFRKKGCATCHGADSLGGAGGPDLSKFDIQEPAETVAGIMWNHALAMNSAMQERGVRWPRFQGSELADLVAFLYFLRFNSSSGDPKRGEELFSHRACAECHAAPDGSPDDSVGPDLFTPEVAGSSEVLVAAMWNHAPLMKKTILSQGRPWPELSGQDLQDLRIFFMQNSHSRE